MDFYRESEMSSYMMLFIAYNSEECYTNIRLKVRCPVFSFTPSVTLILTIQSLVYIFC